MEYIKTLPDEVIINEIFPSLDLKDLSSICKTDSHLRNLCSLPIVWQRRLQAEFPLMYDKKPPNVEWKEYYMYLHTHYNLDAYYKGEIVGIIKMEDQTTFNKNDVLNFQDFQIVVINNVFSPVVIYNDNKTTVNIHAQKMEPWLIVLLDKDVELNVSGKSTIDRLIGHRNLIQKHLFSYENRYPYYAIMMYDRTFKLVVSGHNNQMIAPCVEIKGNELAVIANYLGINGSSCNNILKRLDELGHVFDPFK